MLYKEIIAVCSQIHTKYISTPCGQNVGLLNVHTGLQSQLVTHRSVCACRRWRALWKQAEWAYAYYMPYYRKWTAKLDQSSFCCLSAILWIELTRSYSLAVFLSHITHSAFSSQLGPPGSEHSLTWMSWRDVEHEKSVVFSQRCVIHVWIWGDVVQWVLETELEWNSNLLNPFKPDIKVIFCTMLFWYPAYRYFQRAPRSSFDNS